MLALNMVAAGEWVEPGRTELKDKGPWKPGGKLGGLSSEGGEGGGGPRKARVPLGGRTWKGRRWSGGGGKADLQGRQAHLRLISTTQSMDLIELLPEAVRVTGCKDRTKPWGGRKEVEVSEERGPHPYPGPPPQSRGLLSRLGS